MSEPKVLVCGYISGFPDDLETRCADGGETIYFRPHAPTDVIRLCLRCTLRRIKKEGVKPTIEITEKTKQELREYFSSHKF